MSENRLNPKSMNRFLRDLRPLLIEWDPIGVFGEGSDCPEDEYDCAMRVITSCLTSGASEDEAVVEIRRWVRDHMGIEAADQSTRKLVRSAVDRWLRAGLTKHG